MKERPILFSAPMVRAILEGRKTKTRRVVKDVPDWCRDWGFTAFTPAGSISARGPVDDNVGEKFFRLKYGAVGDRLWVRETWCVNPRRLFGIKPERPEHCLYRATVDPIDAGFQWTPSIHMPRWASRITLEITGVRVERLQEISEDDIQSEGITNGVYLTEEKRRAEWQALWTKINGHESWAANPWVWVIEFRRVLQ